MSPVVKAAFRVGRKWEGRWALEPQQEPERCSFLCVEPGSALVPAGPGPPDLPLPSGPQHHPWASVNV